MATTTVAAEVFLSDIFCSPPSEATQTLALNLVCSKISPHYKKLLNNWLENIAKPHLFPQFSIATVQKDSPLTLIDTTLKHFFESPQGQITLEKIYLFPHTGRKIHPDLVIKTSIFGQIRRGYLLKQLAGQPVLQIDTEVCLKISNLSDSSLGTRSGTRDRVFENALKELDYLLVLSKLNHPHIISLLMHGVIQKQGVSHLVLVFPLGKMTLANRLQLGTVSLETIILAKENISSALIFLHSVGFAHRDVSLENIVEMPNGSFVLIDFGLAKRLTLNINVWQNEPLDFDSNTGAKFLVGKPSYLAPEFFLNEQQEFDLCKGDIFSFGVCLLFLAVRQFPFHHRYAEEPKDALAWRTLYAEMANNHLVSICQKIPEIQWLGDLLWLNPLQRGGLRALLPVY